MTTQLTRTEALAIVLDELGAALERSESPADVKPTEATRLMGSNAPLDSVGLVSLIVGVETTIQTRFGARIELAGDHAMSRRPSPFRSAGALADYLVERVSPEG